MFDIPFNALSMEISGSFTERTRLFGSLAFFQVLLLPDSYFLLHASYCYFLLPAFY